MITAVAIQRAVKDKEEELVELMEKLTTQVKANEPGCTLFLYLKSIDQPLLYIVIEQYKDQAAFDFHRRTPYLNSFIPKMMRCLEKAPEVMTCNTVFS